MAIARSGRAYREFRAVLSSGLLLVLVCYIAVFGTSPERHTVRDELPGFWLLGGFAGGAADVLLVGFIAYLLGVVAADVGSWIFQLSKRSRECTTSRVRARFWVDRDQFLAKASDDDAPCSGSAPGPDDPPPSEDYAGPSADVSWRPWRIPSSRDVEREIEDFVWRKAEEVGCQAVGDVAAHLRDDKGLGVRIEAARRAFPHWCKRLPGDWGYVCQVVLAECKSGNVDDSLLFSSETTHLYDVVDRLRAEAGFRAAIVVPTWAVVVALALNWNIGIAALSIVVSLLYMLFVARQAILIRQQWQRLLMRAVAFEQLVTPTTKKLGTASSGSEREPGAGGSAPE